MCKACCVQCSMCSMKCTNEVAGAGTVSNVHCTVYSVLPATGEDLAVETGWVNPNFT